MSPTLCFCHLWFRVKYLSKYRTDFCEVGINQSLTQAQISSSSCNLHLVLISSSMFRMSEFSNQGLYRIKEKLEEEKRTLPDPPQTFFVVCVNPPLIRNVELPNKLIVTNVNACQPINCMIFFFLLISSN